MQLELALPGCGPDSDSVEDGKMFLCAELMMAESLADLCLAANGDAEFSISENEAHYLKTLAVAMDDDITSFLLLKKMAFADVLPQGELSAGTVVVNSFVEFSAGEKQKAFCQLVWPSREIPYGISVTSRLGAGLIGLSSGQVVLWPDEDGQLRPLHVLRVENYPGLSRWFEGK